MYKIFTAFACSVFPYTSLIFLLRMKIIVVFLVICFQIQAAVRSQTVTLEVENTSLKEVFKEIRRQTAFGFLYKEADLRGSKPVAVSMKNKPLSEVLDACLRDQPLTYEIEKNFVVVRRKNMASQSHIVAQSREITGTVTGENNEPLSAVSIAVKGTSIRAVSDAQGKFRINVPDQEAVLVFTYLGFTPQEKKVGNDTMVNVRLSKQVSEINEVVVTALGIERSEKALGYAVTQVSGEQLTEALSNNWTDALSGKVAGLNLVRSGAGPTGSNKIILRGENNLTGDNDALIVVDGVVINNSSGRMTGTGNASYLGEDSPVDFGNGLNDINPEDIESVSVLKGPGASALYGQRGANGAIVITTKSGKPRVKE